MMRIGICDDEAVFRENVVSYCEKEFASEQPSIYIFTSGEELLEFGEEMDYLFLDIEMSGMDGIFVKNSFEKLGRQTRIIFLTSHKERMVEAFGLNVIGFLAKPLQPEEFSTIAKKMKELLHRDMVEWSEGGECYYIPTSSIRYVEAQDKYTIVHTHTNHYLVRRTVKEWEEILPATSFCRVNRSYLIHFDLFDRLKDTIDLENGKTIRLSRKNKAEIFEHYKKFLRQKAEEMG
jgi:DNA-binding LytR/AlgR family response regulator